jgi:outer membrane lipoprotein SlyB
MTGILYYTTATSSAVLTRRYHCKSANFCERSDAQRFTGAVGGAVVGAVGGAVGGVAPSVVGAVMGAVMGALVGALVGGCLVGECLGWGARQAGRE